MVQFLFESRTLNILDRGLWHRWSRMSARVQCDSLWYTTATSPATSPATTVDLHIATR